MWGGIQPALKLLEDSLPRRAAPPPVMSSDSSGASGGLPWGFGERRNNALPPEELVRQGKLLPEEPPKALAKGL